MRVYRRLMSTGLRGPDLLNEPRSYGSESAAIEGAKRMLSNRGLAPHSEIALYDAATFNRRGRNVYLGKVAFNAGGDAEWRPAPPQSEES